MRTMGIIILLLIIAAPVLADDAVYQVAASADDTYMRLQDNYVSEATMRWPYGGDTYRTFVRWQIDIPPGAVIQSATVQVCSNSTSSDQRVVQMQLLDSGDCPDFTTNPHNFAVRGSTIDWTTGPPASGILRLTSRISFRNSSTCQAMPLATILVCEPFG